MLPSAVARKLAHALSAGLWEADRLWERGKLVLGKRPLWLRGLIRRVLAKFPVAPPRRIAILALHIRRDAGFQRATQISKFTARGRKAAPSRNELPDTLAKCVLPELRTIGDVATWLELSPRELEWFADAKELERHAPEGPLQNYRYRWKVKRSGEQRLLEAPKPRLKAVQRRILSGLLDRVPPHEAAHGFCIHRSIKTFATPHVKQRIVLKLDLADFFPTIRRAQLVALFCTLGYPPSVAMLLACLCTNSAPRDCWSTAPGEWKNEARWKTEGLYLPPHLPQGAPTSPALANLCVFRLDCRLAGMARAANGTYTRYADDLAFSGGREFERGIDRFHTHACAAILEEGFAVNHHKTRFMRRGTRQRLAGVVVNEHTNITRDEFDRLKAILHNCAKKGPAEQNHAEHADFRAHLVGRVSHVALLNPARGEKLRRLLERITWG